MARSPPDNVREPATGVRARGQSQRHTGQLGRCCDLPLRGDACPIRRSARRLDYGSAHGYGVGLQRLNDTTRGTRGAPRTTGKEVGSAWRNQTASGVPISSRNPQPSASRAPEYNDAGPPGGLEGQGAPVHRRKGLRPI